MTIDQKLCDLRRKSGLSQNELAQKLEVSRQSVSKWENGTSIPSYSKIQLLSEVFGVTAEYLMNDNLDEPMSEQLNDNFKTETLMNTAVKSKIYYIVLLISAIIVLLMLVLSMFVTSYKEIPIHYDKYEVVDIDGTADASEFDGVEVTETKGLFPFLSTYNLEIIFLIVCSGIIFGLIGIILQKRRIANVKS